MAALAALTLVVAGGASRISPADAAAPQPFAPIALGVFLGETDALGSQIDAFRASTGATPAIVMWYQGFDQHLYRPAQMAAVAARGEIPEITWDPAWNGSGIPLRDIAAGDYDTYLQASARLAIAWGKPMFIRFAPEMNIKSSLWGPSTNGNTAADYVAAWRHVVGVFRSVGAKNVQWIWGPDQDCNGRCPFTAFYPGDAWVDWVGLDGYNGGAALGAPWLSLAQELGHSYAAITQLTQKPLMIAETASGELGGDKAAWIRQAFLSDIPSSLPRVRAVTWFDVNKETAWSVDSSPAALQAFRTVMQSPLYAGGGVLSATSGPPPATIGTSLRHLASHSSTTRVSGAVGRSRQRQCRASSPLLRALVRPSKARRLSRCRLL